MTPRLHFSTAVSHFSSSPTFLKSRRSDFCQYILTAARCRTTPSTRGRASSYGHLTSSARRRSKPTRSSTTRRRHDAKECTARFRSSVLDPAGRGDVARFSPDRILLTEESAAPQPDEDGRRSAALDTSGLLSLPPRSQSPCRRPEHRLRRTVRPQRLRGLEEARRHRGRHALVDHEASSALSFLGRFSSAASGPPGDTLGDVAARPPRARLAARPLLLSGPATRLRRSPGRAGSR